MPNSVVIYSVRAEFDDVAVRQEYVEFLQAGHCAAVVRQGGALSGEVTVLLAEAGAGAGGVVDVRYVFGSQADFDDYEAGAAVELRAEAAREFPAGSGIRLSQTLGVRVVRVPD